MRIEIRKMRIEIRSDDGTTVIEVPVMGVPTAEFVPIPTDARASVRSTNETAELSVSLGLKSVDDLTAELHGREGSRHTSKKLKVTQIEAHRYAFVVDNQGSIEELEAMVDRHGGCNVVGGSKQFTMQMRHAVEMQFSEMLPLYRAEKAKRSVTISRETMRSPSEDPGNLPVLVAGLSPVWSAYKDAKGRWLQFVDKEHIQVEGWWPMPCLDPMPAEFDGWQV